MGRLGQMMFTVPPALLKFIGPEVPRALRMNAARGTLPLPPKDLTLAVFALTRDQDEEISGAAAQTLIKTPATLLKPVISDQNLHPLVLDFFARNLSQDSELQEVIALNKGTDDETIVYLATLTNKRVIEIISNNQIRFLRHPEIIDVLSENPLTSASVLDRIIKFIEHESGGRKQEAKTAPAPDEESMEVEIEEVNDDAPPEVTQNDELGPVTTDEVVENAWSAFTYDHDLMHDKEFANPEEQEEEAKNLAGKIQNMKVSQKVKLAMVGNLSARSVLIRDSNKLVSAAVLKSPKITESEIEGVSKSRTVSEEVIRIIAHSKEWTRSYQIKLNLVNNSKTPMGDVLRFLNFIRDKELTAVAKSKNVPQPVQQAARKLINTRAEATKKKSKK
jgi:hypothetical protein